MRAEGGVSGEMSAGSLRIVGGALLIGFAVTRQFKRTCASVLLYGCKLCPARLCILGVHALRNKCLIPSSVLGSLGWRGRLAPANYEGSQA